MSSSKHNQEVLDKFIDNNIDEHEEMLADLRRKEEQEAHSLGEHRDCKDEHTN